MESKPTRIISEPGEKTIIDSAGRKAKVIGLCCDDGKTYTVQEMAKLLGISRYTLYQRIALYGWEHRNVLAPPTPKGLTIDGKKQNPNYEGSQEWRQMSGRQRSWRLASIPGPGSFERTL